MPYYSMRHASVTILHNTAPHNTKREKDLPTTSIRYVLPPYPIQSYPTPTPFPSQVIPFHPPPSFLPSCVKSDRATPWHRQLYGIFRVHPSERKACRGSGEKREQTKVKAKTSRVGHHDGMI